MSAHRQAKRVGLRMTGTHRRFSHQVRIAGKLPKLVVYRPESGNAYRASEKQKDQPHSYG